MKIVLNNNGFDLIKKRMHKDGHLVDDMQQYLRTRHKRSNTPHIMIHSPFFAFRGAEQDWNEGEVVLTLTPDAFEVQPDCADRLYRVAMESKAVEWIDYADLTRRKPC